MHTTVTVTCPIAESPRVSQVRRHVRSHPRAYLEVTWSVHLPIDQEPWHVGLVVGPSGCGKSTIARHLWPDALRAATNLTWDPSRSSSMAFRPVLSIKDITALLCSVGFSSPPAWLRPFHVLSTGQQFASPLPRLLAQAATDSAPSLVVCDEFTSVVDRTVAQIGSCALAKTVRQAQPTVHCDYLS